MKALLIVDLQNDFLDGGPLEVKGSSHLIDVINNLIDKFPLTVASKDWHPKGHHSFLSSHSKKALWPDHCIQNSFGSEFPSSLHQDKIKKVFYKGSTLYEESYSAFYVAESGISTGLDEYLKKHEVTELFIVGLALEYCVSSTVVDAIKLGYKVTVILDAVGSISEHQKQMSLSNLNSLGVIFAKSWDYI